MAARCQAVAGRRSGARGLPAATRAGLVFVLGVAACRCGFAFLPSGGSPCQTRPAAADAASAAVTRRELLLPGGTALSFGWASAASSATAEVTMGLGGQAVDTDNIAGSIVVGRYTDPFHPGGIRDIELQDQKLGNFQLLKVKGGGGRGEPEFYQLSGMIGPSADDKHPERLSIMIDFSPKGGPRDLLGYWDQDGITWPDGNHWPKKRAKKTQ
eukprot:TRINITY_DN100732_c0_g1_i1.p1 TRINITY_DN100732_c0_g1~~TRINITY_DN100732_c0_g1_i1.p1  ORF type:complete len:239 (+),score=36.98 TRINITY_DN100732_c0_g1_i1:80-718(+)